MWRIQRCEIGTLFAKIVQGNNHGKWACLGQGRDAPRLGSGFLGRSTLVEQCLAIRSTAVGIALALICGSWSVAGEWIDHSIRSERLAGNLVGDSPQKDFTVYLPDSYGETDKEFPVIYWIPGYNQVRTWRIERERIQEEFSSGRADPAIMVFLPVRTNFGSSTYLSSDVFGDWEGFLTEEVIPFIDTTYRTEGTADQRGIMGFSLGGFASLTLPTLSPNTFSAVGANDPALSLVSGLVRSPDEIPEGVPASDQEFDLNAFFDAFPDSVEGYNDVGAAQSLYGQIAASFAPNEDHPLRGELPFTREGEWNPDARAAWREYDLLDPDSVARHLDALSQLGSVSVTLPDESTGTPWSRALIDAYREAGLPVQGLPVTGDHNDDQFGRFTMLLSNVSYTLRGENRTVLSGGVYRQDFDQIGTDDVNGVDLPDGWSVTDEHGFIFRDRTNTAYRGGAFELVGQGPHILNVGPSEDADRALGVHTPVDAGISTIQFLADVEDVVANTLAVSFDVDVVGSGAASLGDSEVVLLELAAELDFGGGLREMMSLGQVTSGMSLETPIGIGADAYNASFETSLNGAFDGLESIRLLWHTVPESGSPEWVLSLDNVQLEFELRGDFDADSLLTVADMDLLSTAVRDGDGSDIYDVTGDGLVDDADRQHWVEELVGTQFGDADLDQTVGFRDFVLMANRYGEPGGWGRGDFDGSGIIDFADWIMLATNFGNPSTSTAISAVPEPHAWVMIFAWLPIWGACRRRRG